MKEVVELTISLSKTKVKRVYDYDIIDLKLLQQQHYITVNLLPSLVLGAYLIFTYSRLLFY